MAANPFQKIAVVDITAATEQLIRDKLSEGYVIQFIVNLQPKFEKLLIVYATPETFSTP